MPQLPVYDKQGSNATRHAKRHMSAAADIRGTATGAKGTAAIVLPGSERSPAATRDRLIRRLMQDAPRTPAGVGPGMAR